MNTPDFNLLLTLDALLDEGSVAGAARRLSLSPSAMSRALARLRETTGIRYWCGRVGVWCPRRGPWSCALRSASWCRMRTPCCAPSRRWILRAWNAPFV